MQWPENLGSGKPAHVDCAYEYYHMGLCYSAMGKDAACAESFGKAASGNSPWATKAAEEMKKLGN